MIKNKYCVGGFKEVQTFLPLRGLDSGIKNENIHCVSIVFIFIFIKMQSHASLGGLAQVNEKYIVLAGFLCSDLYFAFLTTVFMINL